jgi:hypothetical protein
MPSQTFGGVGSAPAAGRNHNKPGEEEVARRRRQGSGCARGQARLDHQPTQHRRANKLTIERRSYSVTGQFGRQLTL